MRCAETNIAMGIEDREKNFLFLLNHLEYDSNSLNDEYLRDKDAEKSLQVPKNYITKET